VKYWLRSVRRVEPGVFDVEVTHGVRRLAYRFTVERHGPVLVYNSVPPYPADFPGRDGSFAVRRLYYWLEQAYDDLPLPLPIDLTEDGSQP
jgi:hypothetical protein